VPLNKKKLLKKLIKVEKDQDQKLWCQAEVTIRETKEFLLKKIINRDPKPKKNTLISQRQKDLRDHLLAEVHLLVKIKLKVKIAKIRTSKILLVKKLKVPMIRYIPIVLNINQPLIIVLTDTIKKREKEEVAELQTEEAAPDHLKL
jgi:hypothetical protein